MRRLFTAATFAAALVALISTGSAVGKHNPPGPKKKPGPANMSVFATGFNNPRGLAFGPDGNLYVAEGGLGGSDSTVGQCPQAAGAAAPYTGSTNNPVLGGRISKVSPTGAVSTVVDSLPSSETSAALGHLVSGVSSVAFIGNQLYGLLAGAGCSHGVPTVPNGVIKVGPGSTWSMLANLSAFQAANPVANPDLATGLLRPERSAAWSTSRPRLGTLFRPRSFATESGTSATSVFSAPRTARLPTSTSTC